MDLTTYLTIASISLIIFYLCYHFFLRKSDNLKQIRQFLLFAIIFSLILPFNPVSIDIQSFNYFNAPQNLGVQNRFSLITNQLVIQPNESVDFKDIISLIYYSITFIFALRILFSLARIIRYLLISEKQKKEQFTLVFIDKEITAFSFFRWIFISKSNKYNQSTQIIEHEKVHALQYHTFDVLLSELLVAAMWFNPFVWMLKKALTQVHEFLADEGVIKSGYDKLEYQSIIVNQVAEGRLVAISSNFSYSLIKKRVMMLSKTKKQGGSKLKLLIIMPLVGILLMGVSVQNREGTAKAEQQKINRDELKSSPDEILITKNELITYGKIELSPDDSDFASAFRVVSFTVSTKIGMYEESYDQTRGPSFTPKQVDLIKRALPGRKVYIENIKAIGPEGETRDLGSIVFKLKG